MQMMTLEDAFQILDLSERATPDDIKNAYRIMALKWHPDRYYGAYDKDKARVRFLRITNAYRTLVIAGYIPRLQHPISDNLPELHHPPLMVPRSSSESLVSLRSIVHPIAESSTESDTTTTTTTTTLSLNMRDGPRYTSDRHTRASVESFVSQRDSPYAQNGSTGYRHMRNADEPTAHIHSLSPGSKPHFTDPANTYHQQPHHNSNVGQSQPNVSSTTLLSPSDFLPPISQKTSYIPGAPPSYPIPLPSIGLGLGGEWTYSLTLTLEELFAGKRCRFGIVRSYLSQKTKRVIIEIDIPPGCRPGTRILCRGVGHECRPGIFQDIAFVVEEAPHDRFVRLFDDLIMDIRLPCVDSLRKRGSKIPFTGVDGNSLVVHIDYPKDQKLKGRIVLKGAGMPIREHGRVVGRGNVVVQWEILPRKTKIVHLFKRLFGIK